MLQYGSYHLTYNVFSRNVQTMTRKGTHSYLFLTVCLAYGMSIGHSWSGCYLSRLFLAADLIMYALCVCFYIETVSPLLFTRPNVIALLGIVQLALYLLLAAYTFWFSTYRRTRILKLLRHSQSSHWIVHTTICLLKVPYVASRSTRILNGFILGQISLSETIFEHALLFVCGVEVFIQVLYIEITCSLMDRCEILLTKMSRLPWINVGSLLDGRWQLREAIRQTNALFAVPLGICYSLIFMNAIVFVGFYLQGLAEVSLDQVAFKLCYVVQMYVIST